MIRFVIVDDEPLAREGLRRRLQRDPELELVGEAADGAHAIELVRRELPDLMFLDVQMPGLDGFATLARLADDHLPLVVFVTAFDVHALRAFEVHAVDYLLKPLDDGRLADAILRVKHELGLADAATGPERVAQLLDAHAGLAESQSDSSLPAPPGRVAPLRRFVVRERGRFRLVPVEAVEWVESAGNYVQVHTAHGSHLVRMTLARAEARLVAPGFVRIHRSTLVRPERVESVQATGNGDFLVRLVGGRELPMSRRYRGRLLHE
jgi:two-component system LytT family response regulator